MGLYSKPAQIVVAFVTSTFCASPWPRHEIVSAVRPARMSPSRQRTINHRVNRKHLCVYRESTCMTEGRCAGTEWASDATKYASEVTDTPLAEPVRMKGQEKSSLKEIPGDRQFKSPRLTLQRLTSDDISCLAKHANDWEIHKSSLQIPYPYTQSDAEDFIRKVDQSWDQQKEYVFGIFHRKENHFIGVCGIHLEEEHHRGFVGYWIARKFWGNGYATEALREIVCFGFGELELNRIYGEYFVGNEASCKVMGKVGMKKEGVMRSHVWKVNKSMNLQKVLDVGICGILRSEWAN